MFSLLLSGNCMELYVKKNECFKKKYTLAEIYKFMKKITLIAFLIFFSITHAQLKPKTNFGKTIQGNSESGVPIQRCSTTEYEELLRAQNPDMPSKKEFNDFINSRIQEELLKKGSLPNGTQNTNVVVTIPVVVHVIHNGDAYGTNENIHDLQVQSQITVLNQDFRRLLGTPGYNTNPVGADVEIEFCLAQRNPNNQPSNGINRVNLGVASYNTISSVNTTVKPQTQWDPNKYLNLWCVNLGGGLLGYAQFPNSSTSTTVAQTDGVVIGHSYFGSSAIYPAGTYSAPYDRGRTATHEVGHYFGLYHIWGDNNNCTVDATDSLQDFCLDTPAAANENYGCPANADSCPTPAGVPDMIQNYMDYTNDLCMNIFTQNQKTRMLAVLNSFPRRLQLLTSNGCQAVQSFGFDGNISITNLNVSACGTTLSPVLTLENVGTNTLTSAVISYNIDGNNPQTLPWTGSLASGQSTTINVGTLTTTAGAHTFNASIVTVNGQTDQNTFNNNTNQAFTVVSNFASNAVNFRLQLDFFGEETTWTLKNSAGTTLYSGNNYPVTTTSNTGVMGALIQQSWNLASNDCYTFTINDSYGDGICCQYGAGFYDIKTPTGDVIISGATFTNTQSKSFAINLLSVGEVTPFEGMYVYPNPTNDQLNVFVSNEIGLPESYVIYNSLGQIVANKAVSSTVDLSINTSNYSKGVYFIKLTKENQSKTLRFIKN